MARSSTMGAYQQTIPAFCDALVSSDDDKEKTGHPSRQGGRQVADFKMTLNQAPLDGSEIADCPATSGEIGTLIMSILSSRYVI